MKNLFRFLGILAILFCVHFSHAQTVKYKVYRVGDDAVVTDSAGTAPLTREWHNFSLTTSSGKIAVQIAGFRKLLTPAQLLDKDGIPYDVSSVSAALNAFRTRNEGGFYKIPSAGTVTFATASGSVSGSGVLYWKLKNTGAAAASLQFKNSKTGADVGAAITLGPGEEISDEVKQTGGYLVDCFTVSYTISTATTIRIITKTRP